METLKITLTETKDFELVPFGGFDIKWKVGKKPHRGIIGACDISYNYDEGMPMPTQGEEDKAVVALMKKNKTAVLTNVQRTEFYTRLGKGLSKIQHKNIRDYVIFLYQRELDDTKEAWKEFIKY
jgi:hypothetical protein